MSNDDNRCMPILIKSWHSNIGDALIYNSYLLVHFQPKNNTQSYLSQCPDIMLPYLNQYLSAPSDPQLTMDYALLPDYMLRIFLQLSCWKNSILLEISSKVLLRDVLATISVFHKVCPFKSPFAGQVSKGTASRMSTLSNIDLCKFVQVCIFFSTTQQSLSIT